MYREVSFYVKPDLHFEAYRKLGQYQLCRKVTVHDVVAIEPDVQDICRYHTAAIPQAISIVIPGCFLSVCLFKLFKSVVLLLPLFGLASHTGKHPPPTNSLQMELAGTMAVSTPTK